jgi:predicted GNAT family N-acyltransferase
LIRVKSANWAEDEAAIKSVRIPVFVEEQQVPFEIDFDTHDATAEHWLALDANNQPVGTARMRSDGHFGRMAVLKNHRHKGIGRLIMAAAIDYAVVSGMQKIHLYAQLTALPFYQSAGFTAYGEVFLEAGMEHIAMLKQLSS